MAGEATVAREAGEQRVVAEILAMRPAIGAMATSPAQPGHADPLSGASDAADDLVAGDDGERTMELAVEDVEIGAADPAGGDLDQQLAGAGFRNRPLDHAQRRAGPIELHRAHHAPQLNHSGEGRNP